MVVPGVIAAVLLAAVLAAVAAVGTAPARARRARRERLDHDLVVACLQNADELAHVPALRVARAGRPYVAAWGTQPPARRLG